VVRYYFIIELLFCWFIKYQTFATFLSGKREYILGLQNKDWTISEKWECEEEQSATDVAISYCMHVFFLLLLDGFESILQCIGTSDLYKSPDSVIASRACTPIEFAISMLSSCCHGNTECQIRVLIFHICWIYCPGTCWLGTSRRELVVSPCHHGPLKLKHWKR
jgi:hypothetical protein